MQFPTPLESQAQDFAGRCSQARNDGDRIQETVQRPRRPGFPPGPWGAIPTPALTLLQVLGAEPLGAPCPGHGLWWPHVPFQPGGAGLGAEGPGTNCGHRRRQRAPGPADAVTVLGLTACCWAPPWALAFFSFSVFLCQPQLFLFTSSSTRPLAG